MPVPTILLREFKTATISDWIPGKLVQTFKQLESLSFDVLTKDANEWTVHFHLEDGLCKGKIVPSLWNNANYFDESCLEGDKLHVFAHFEKSNGKATSTSASRAVNSSTILHSDKPLESVSGYSCSRERGVSLRYRVSNDPPTGGTKPSLTKKPLTRGTKPPLSKELNRSRVQAVSSDSDSESSDETHFVLSPSDRGTGSMSGETGSPENLQRGTANEVLEVTSLPVGATGAQHALDFQVALSKNAAPREYGHKWNWDDVGAEFHAKIAHARLIKGAYGTSVSPKCARCALMGLDCRVYHPLLNAPAAKVGSCGECRLVSQTCSLNQARQQVNDSKPSEKKRKKSVAAAEQTPNKAPRVDKDGKDSSEPDHAETAKEALFCPIKSCPRHWEAFGQRYLVIRHMKSVHPEEDILDRGEGRSISDAPKDSTKENQSQKSLLPRNFVCPVRSCERAVKGINRIDNLRTHIVNVHPSSVHAQIIEAVRNKSRIRLPKPLPGIQYKADFEGAKFINATKDRFGHREPATWTRAHPSVRTRIAHAKLIHGMYGVLAPEPCVNCRERKVTCMVYHPGLRDVGRVLGAACGECRDQNARCTVDPKDFQRILLSDDEVPMDSDALDSTNVNTLNGARDQPERIMIRAVEKTRIKHDMDAEDDGESVGLGADAYQERPITDEDLAQVTAASDGALQIG